METEKIFRAKPNLLEIEDKMNEIKTLIEKAYGGNKWRGDFLDAYPSFDNRKGIDAINNFLYRKVFRWEVYEAIVQFLKSKLV